MSDKEMLKEADEWLYSMKCLLSVKTDEEDRAYTQKRIDLFNWLIEQAECVQESGKELERIKVKYRSTKESHYQYSELTSELEYQNKRYREAISYVMEAESSHYDNNLVHALDDIKFVINETLKGR